MKRFSLTIVFLSIFTISLAFSEDDPVIAKAGDIVFRLSELQRLISYSPQNLRDELNKNPAQMELLVKKIMQNRILSSLARKDGLDQRPDVKEQLNYMMDDFLGRLYIFLNVTEKIKLTEDVLKEYYDKNKEKFTIPEQVRARHILIKVPFAAPTEEKAKAKEKIRNISEWLKKGERFEILAEQYSEDTTSNKRGGDLGYFQRGRMPKAFDDMAFSMKTGQISDIVETDYGYHIIKVEDRKDAKTKTFEEVKVQIKEKLTEEITRTRIEEFIKKVENDSGLEIHSERFIHK